MTRYTAKVLMTKPLMTEEPCECESLKHGSGLAAGEVIPPPTITESREVRWRGQEDFVEKCDVTARVEQPGYAKRGC